MDMALNGRHALVCGASRGIGRACAETLASLGARVTVVARDAKTLETVASGLPAVDSGHGVLAVDLSADDASDTVAAYLADRPAQILINNTGGPPPGPILEADGEAFLAGMRAHLVANQANVRAALPGMRAAGYGRVINIISTSVREPIPGLGVSNAVRAAVAAWAKTLAGELAPEGFTVNNVLPGFTATDRLDSLIAGKARAAGTTEAEVAEQMRAGVPMARFAAPEEIAAVAAFLASPTASYVTGVSIPVDGGRTRSL